MDNNNWAPLSRIDVDQIFRLLTEINN